jgi:hypothetical protein
LDGNAYPKLSQPAVESPEVRRESGPAAPSLDITRNRASFPELENGAGPFSKSW